MVAIEEVKWNRKQSLFCGLSSDIRLSWQYWDKLVSFWATILQREQIFRGIQRLCLKYSVLAFSRRCDFKAGIGKLTN